MILYTLTSILCLTAVVMSLKDALRGLILVCAVLGILLVSLAVMEPKSDAESESESNKNTEGKENGKN